MGATLETILILAAIITLASFSQAVSGFGFSLIAIPIAMPFIGVQQAIAIATLLSLVLAASVAIKLRSEVEWNPTLTVTGSAIVGMPFGLALLLLLDSSYISLLIGVLVIASVVMLATGRLRSIGGRGGVLGAGFLSGMLLSSTGINGPPLVIAFQSMRMSPRTFRASLQVTFTIADFFVLIGFALVGTLTWSVALTALIVSPMLALGWWLGDLTFKRLNPRAFRVAVLIMLGLSGCMAVFQAVTQLLSP